MYLNFFFLRDYKEIRTREEGRENLTLFRRADLNGGQGFFHFSALQRKGESQFSGMS